MSTLGPILFYILFQSLTSSAYDWGSNDIKEYVCGEILTAGRGTLESPLFPNLYPSEADCSWLVEAQPGHQIRLKSEYFSIEHQPECLWDYLVISDGSDGEFGQAVYCGSEELNFQSESNIINIHFHSDVSGSDVGFRINYENVPPESMQDIGCNMTISQEGTVTSPGYPNSYPPEMDCFYSIQAPLNYKILLEFTNFDVENGPCNFDKLEVYDGDTLAFSSLLGIFCGRSLPKTLTSLSNNMTLRFITDLSIQSQGFSALVQFLPDKKVFSSTESLLNQSTSAVDETVATQSTNQTTSNSDSSTQEIKQSTPASIHFTEPTEKSLNAVKNCNITITSNSSNISSPNFPQNYPSDTICVTKLRSTVNSTFLITFTNFSIEEDEFCDYDSLSIFQGGINGSEANQTLLKCLCGNNLQSPILSFEGYGLDLIFRSDMSTSDSGYMAHVLIAPLVHVPSCSAACENGGNCTEILLADGAIDWMCICPERFTGTLCEGQVRETCWEVKCLNGGTCSDDGVNIACICSNGFYGRFCEQFDKISEGGSLYFTKMIGNMSVSVGSSIILECAVNDPSAHVMWLFQDLIMTNADWSHGVEVHPGGVVVIPEIDDIHSGRYTCMAVTSDDLVERSMWISLKEPCDLHVVKSPSNVTVREGQTALFQCYVPDADVMLWRKDGDIVSNGPRKRILVNNYLVINPVMETDAGQYTCAARSKNGCFVKVSAYLTVETMGHGKECGRPRNRPPESRSGRISSGREALPGSAPWHVILRESKKDTTFCGGSLISPDTVLTAAHCVGQFEFHFGYPFHPRHIQVYLGTHHCSGNNGLFRQIKSYILHELYNDTHYNNDIAIIKLDSPVSYSDDILPICLETPAFLQELMKPGNLGTITGCGSRYAQGAAPTYLHEVQIPFVSKDICRERASAVRTNFTLGMFCAGYAKSMRGDACSGDSGGPYIIEFRGRYIQAGIVSWGVGCDRENHYGYYTSIAYYYNWIMDKIK